MKVNLNNALQTIYGKDVLDAEESVRLQKPVPLTVQAACCRALTSADAKVDGLERLRRYELAREILRTDGEIELSDEDANRIYDLSLNFIQPEVVGQMRELFKPPSKE